MTDYRDQLNHKLKMHHHPPVPDSSDPSSDTNDTGDNVDSSDSGVEPNYMCITCETKIHIESEHKQITQNWCNSCGDLKRHKRIG